MGDSRGEGKPKRPRSKAGKPSRKHGKPSEIAAVGRLLEVQQFAESVHAFADDVGRFYERRVEDRLATDNHRTRFKNNLLRMREECLELSRVFRRLRKAAKDLPGKAAQDRVANNVIQALSRNGFENTLEQLQKALLTIIQRLNAPLNAEEAKKILEDVRQLWLGIQSLGDFATAIQRNIRHALKKSRSGDAPEIPEGIEKRLVAVEDATRRFIEAVSERPPMPSPEGKALTECLRALQVERDSLIGANKALAIELQAFVSKTTAALAGNPSMISIVQDVKDALSESRFRLAVSTSILEVHVKTFKHEVSRDEAADYAARLQHLLNSVWADHVDIRLRVGKMARKVKAAVADAAIVPANLPELVTLTDDERLLLGVLIAHHDDEGDDTTVTKKELDAAMRKVQPRKESWTSWVDRRLKELRGKGAVVRVPSHRKNRGDEFRLPGAALVKYRSAAGST